MSYWIHTASSPAELSGDVARAQARASALDWQSGSPEARVNDLRAYLAYSAATAAGIAGIVRTGSSEAGDTLAVDPRPRSGVARDRAELAAALLRTPVILAARLRADGLGDSGAVGDLRTSREIEETGLAPLAVVAIAVVAVAAAAAYSYVAFQAAQVVDRYLAREEDTRRLVEVDNRLIELASSHVGRERLAGKSLPLDEGTKAAIAALTAAQRQILQNRPDVRSGFEALGGSWSAGVAGLSLGLVAAIVLAVVLLK